MFFRRKIAPLTACSVKGLIDLDLTEMRVFIILPARALTVHARMHTHILCWIQTADTNVKENET